MAGELIKWSDSYNLGLKEIDEQHEYLLVLMNKAWQSIINRSDINIILGLLEELERYTISHFIAEETFMQAAHFPDFPEHKQEHQKFVSYIIKEKERASQTGNISLDLMHFLRDWLVQHILVSDKSYVDYMEKMKSKETSLLGRFFKRLI
ncbi:bacteriohemerythrin [Iodobacter ciconiae]|nr:bacteriohemerythrin [Iodobacter ciconiae]